MAPNKLSKTLRQGQQLLANIPVQFAAIHIRWKLRARRFAVRRGVTTPSRLRAATAMIAAGFAPGTLRSAAPTSQLLAVHAALRNPLPCRATAHQPAPVLVTIAVRISGRIRSG
jgi:hypothetical protein